MSNINLTIRAKLSILYTAVLCALLFVFCLILYSAIAFSLQSKSKNELLSRAHKISETFDRNTQTFHDLPEGDFNANPLYWFRIVKPDTTLYRPAPVFSILKNIVSLKQISQGPKNDSWFYEFEESGQWFLSVVFPINEDKLFSGWVEVVIPITENKKMLHLILILMCSLGAGIVILLFFSGRFLAKKTLKPVEQIRKQVDAIYEKNLSSRIVSPNPADEIGQLSNTFNHLLQRLEKAFDLQQQFIADASHELKTPITILRSQWEKLASQQDLPYEYRVRIQSDLEELARLSNLINILLLLATPKEKSFTEDFPIINLSELTNLLYDDLIILAGNKNQQISFAVDDNIQVAGDKERIFQLFLNLADNAVKYTPENGSIEIRLKSINNYAEFSIKDNGIGIPEEHLPHVFERFYRVDRSRSRMSGGFGLGLAVCKTIVEAHNGSINIQSDISHGTTVIVKFPQA